MVFRNFRRKDNYEVALDNAEDYPELPEFDASQKVTLASGVLADALSNTLFATSNDSLRPVMTGFFSNLQKKNQFRIYRFSQISGV